MIINQKSPLSIKHSSVLFNEPFEYFKVKFFLKRSITNCDACSRKFNFETWKDLSGILSFNSWSISQKYLFKILLLNYFLNAFLFIWKINKDLKIYLGKKSVKCPVLSFREQSEITPWKQYDFTRMNLEITVIRVTEIRSSIL